MVYKLYAFGESNNMPEAGGVTFWQKKRFPIRIGKRLVA